MRKTIAAILALVVALVAVGYWVGNPWLQERIKISAEGVVKDITPSLQQRMKNTADEAVRNATPSLTNRMKGIAEEAVKNAPPPVCACTTPKKPVATKKAPVKQPQKVVVAKPPAPVVKPPQAPVAVAPPAPAAPAALPPVLIAVPAVPVTPAVLMCPKGFHIIAHLRKKSLLQAWLQDKIQPPMDAANNRDSKQATDPTAYDPPDVAEVAGKDLLKAVYARDLINVDLAIRYLNPKTIAAEGEFSKPLRVRKGIGIFGFPIQEDPREHIVVVAGFPSYLESPSRSGGELQLWIKPSKWVDDKGRPVCDLNVYGIE